MTDTTKIIPTISAEFLRDVADMAEGLRLTWSEGDPMTLMAGDLSEAIQFEALVHGLKQKLVDAAAISRNPDTGKSASVADKRAAVQEVLDRLLAGRWNKGRAEGTGNAREGGLLARAMARHTGKSVDDAKAWLAERTDDEKTALKLNPKIKAIMDEMRAADLKVDASIDTDALIASMTAA